MKNKSIKAYFCCFRIVLLVTLFVVSTLSIAFGKDHVDIKGGKISVSIEDRPLQEVLKKVQSQTAVEVIFLDTKAKSERVGVHFSNLDIVDGLKRILRENYVLRFVKDPQKGVLLSEIRIVSKSLRTDVLSNENPIGGISEPEQIDAPEEVENAQTGASSFCADKDSPSCIAADFITISNEIEIYSPDGSYVATIDLTEEESNEIATIQRNL